MGLKPRVRLTSYQRRAIPALVKSIAHWKRLAAGTQKPLEGWCGSSCACCQDFNGPEGCEDCPVKLRTGQIACRKTPYSWAAEAAWHRRYKHHYIQAHLDREVAYLVETLSLVRSGEIAPPEQS